MLNINTQDFGVSVLFFFPLLWYKNLLEQIYVSLGQIYPLSKLLYIYT